MRKKEFLQWQSLGNDGCVFKVSKCWFYELEIISYGSEEAQKLLEISG